MKKRRMISAVLVVVMLFALLPSGTLTASAADASVSDGAALQTALTDAGKNGGTVTMTGDITGSVKIIVNPNKTVVLDGGDYTLTGTSGVVDATALTVDGSGTLILKNITLQGGVGSATTLSSNGLSTSNTFRGVIATWGYASVIGGSSLSSDAGCQGLDAFGSGSISLTSATGGASGISRGVCAINRTTTSILSVYVGSAAAGSSTTYQAGVAAIGQGAIVNVATSGCTVATTAYSVVATEKGTVNIGTPTGTINNDGGTVNVGTLNNATSVKDSVNTTTSVVKLHKLADSDTCVLDQLIIATSGNTKVGTRPIVVAEDGTLLSWFKEEARTTLFTGTTISQSTTDLYAGSTSFTATVNTAVNGEAADVSGSVQLRQSNAVKYTATKSATGVYTVSADNGTYDVFVNGMDTGIDLPISGAAASVSVPLYTVDFNGTAAGDTTDSTVSAVVGSVDISSGAQVPQGNTVVLTGVGTGATTYTYLWSGEGTNGETDATLTLSNLSAAVHVTCMVTGTYINPVVTAHDSDELKAALGNSYITTINLVHGTEYTYDGGTVTRAVTIDGKGATINVGTGIAGTLVKRQGATEETSVPSANGQIFLSVSGTDGNLTIQNATLKNGENLMLCGIQAKDHASLTLKNVSFENFYGNPADGGTMNNFGVHADPDATAVNIDGCTFDNSNAFRNAVASRGGTLTVTNSYFSGTATPARLNKSDGYEYGIYLYGGTATITNNVMSGFKNAFFPGYLSGPIATAVYFDITATITGNTFTDNAVGLNLVGAWHTLSDPARLIVNGVWLNSSENAYALGETLFAANTFARNSEGALQFNLDQNDFYKSSIDTTDEEYGTPAYFGGFMEPSGKTDTTLSFTFSNAETAKAAIDQQKSFLIEHSTDNGQTWTTAATAEPLSNTSRSVTVTGLTQGTSYLVRAVFTINSDVMPSRGVTEKADIVCYSDAVRVSTIGPLPTPSVPAWKGTTLKWNAVTDAAAYSVQVMKNGAPLGDPIRVTGTEYNLASLMTEAASYSATVTALGNQTSTLDSAASAAVATNIFLITYQNGDDTYAAQPVLSGEKATLPPAPKKSGFVFAGWYKDAGFTNAWTFNSTNVEASSTLFAKWLPAQTTSYSVIYLNGTAGNGSVPIDRTQYAASATVTVKANVGGLAKVGYSFAGWSDGTKTYQPGQSFSIAADKTLTAAWTENPATYAVSFSGGDAAGQTVPAGSLLTPPATPERTGYTFTGWYKDAACQKPWNFNTDTVSGKATLYAGWTQSTSVVGGAVVDADSGIQVKGATVALYQGGVQIGTTTTDDSGAFSFMTVPDGVYSLIVTGSEGQQVTVAVTVKGGAPALEPIKLPAGNKSTLVSVQGEDTPAIVVSGLGALLATETNGGMLTNADSDAVTGGGSVNIVLEVQPSTGSAAQTKVSAALRAAGMTTGTVLDMDLTKITTTNNGAQTQDAITETTDLLTIVIPLPAALQSKEGYVVYRAHGTGLVVDVITQKPNDKLEKIELSGDKTYLTLYAKYFSTYAIGYNTPASPSTPTDGGAIQTSFSITVPASVTGGTISPNGTVSVTKGGSKTFTITPDTGYVISDVLVDGKSVGAVSTYTLSDITAAHTFTAVFTKAAGLPYYLDANGNQIFIGFSSDSSGAMKYIAPVGKSMLLTPNPKSFTDISTHWAKEGIDFVTQRELFMGTGTSTFSPEAGMTRAMLATVMGRLYERSYGALSTAGRHVFADCDYSGWYGSYIDWCAENGIITGVGGGKFEPDRPVTRQEMATMLYRFAQFMKLDTATNGKMLTYPDASSIGDWAQAGALYCQGNGLITGRDNGSFTPAGTATRAEVATILERFIHLVVKNHTGDH